MTNLQGDVISIRDSSGTALVSYTYDAWGNASIACNTDVAWIPYLLAEWNPLRYRGYVYDTETELYYLQSRYYNPKWGRFISADSLDVLTATPMALTDINLFAYCDNNPITRADDDGEFWHIIAGGIIGGVVSFAATLITGGSLKEATVSAAYGFAAGALTMATPSAALVIDVCLGIAEEATINYITETPVSKEAFEDIAILATVDTISDLTSNESQLSQKTMQEFAEAIPKTFKGNHPKVKLPAQKIVRNAKRTILRESGEKLTQKTIGNVAKNFLKIIF